MANLPPWLTSGIPIVEAIDQSRSRDQALEQQRQLAIRDQMFREIQAQRQAEQQAANLAAQQAQDEVANQINFQRLNQAAQENAFQQGNEAQRIGLLKDEASRKANEDAIRFQGAQDLNNLLSQGKSLEDALPEVISKLAYNSPASLVNLADTRSRIKSAEELKNLTINSNEAQKELDRKARLDLELQKENARAANNLKPFDYQEFLKQATVIEHDFNRSPEKKLEDIRALREAAEQGRINKNIQPLPSSLTEGGTSASGYISGRVYGGMQYLGGDPNKAESWKKVR